VTAVLPATTERVPRSTAESVNAAIERRTAESVRRCAAGGPGAIERRLGELDREWDVERTLEANASAIALGGLLLGATASRRWFALPAVVASFLFQHALQGWCPPVPLLRRLGVRTAPEIARERYALKALRGDFASVAAGNPEEALRAVDR
jgi:hypothetical protein